MDKVVDEIGEKNVVQVVTDNEAAMKAAGQLLMQKRRHLYWTACAAHCIDLMLEDIGKKSTVKKVLDDARTITSFIYNHTWVIDYMKQFTGGKELLRSSITRFATNFIALESLLRYKKELRDMINSDGWKNSVWGKKKNGPAYDMKKIILGRDFWHKAGDIVKVEEPLVKVLKLVDGDDKPTMGFIYEAMDRAKLAIQRDCRYYKEYWKIIDKRWNFQLHHDLHAAGYFLNPQFLYEGATSIASAIEAMKGVKDVITTLEPDMDNQIRAINQILLYRDKLETFGTPLAQRAVMQTNPAEWWIHYGTCAPELQQIAVKVLSQTTSSSNCERNWSTFSQIHTKTRNRLKYKKLQKLVFLHYNMRLKLRHISRRSQQEIDASFNPINLDYIFDEDDPLSPWLEEREAPLLDERDDNEWLELSSDDEPGQPSPPMMPEPEQQRSSSSSSTPTASGTGSDPGGLSPPSQGNEGTGGEGTTSVDPTSPFRGNTGDQSIHGFRPDEEIGEPIERPRGRGPRLSGVAPRPDRRGDRGCGGGRELRRNQRRNCDSSEESSSHSMIRSFGDFGLGASSSESSYQPSYPYHPPYAQYDNYPSYPPQPTPYSSSLFNPPPSYGNPSPPLHYQEQQDEHGSYGSFIYIYPQGWGDDQQGTSQSQATNNDQEEPRHSFWW